MRFRAKNEDEVNGFAGYKILDVLRNVVIENLFVSDQFKRANFLEDQIFEMKAVIGQKIYLVNSYQVNHKKITPYDMQIIKSIQNRIYE